MLNEVLHLMQGDLSKFTESAPFAQRHENGKEQDETERNNEAFYEGYQGECNQ